MTPNRRDFFRSAAIGAAALGTSALGLPAAAAGTRPGEAPRPARSGHRQLRILVLGGTGFIGPHLVRAILARGHTPVLFNRGRTAPQLFVEQFEGLENLVGDRNDDISALASGRWDVVIDDSGYTPQQVRATAELLRDRVGLYIFTSTRGVYAGFTADVIDEDAPVGMRGVPDSEWTGYGPLKALAEREVQQALPGRYMIARPPIITGPGDGTDRFTYWYVRIDRGGDIIAPGDPDDPIQYVDVRDLVDFYVHAAENGVTGTYNVAGPAAPLSSAEFLYGIRAVTPAPVAFTWVDWDFLASHDIRQGRELSSWRAPRGEDLNYGRVDNSRAQAAGMRFRPLADTARDTLEWWKSLPDERRQRMTAGIPADREQAVLAAWRDR